MTVETGTIEQTMIIENCLFNPLFFLIFKAYKYLSCKIISNEFFTWRMACVETMLIIIDYRNSNIMKQSSE